MIIDTCVTAESVEITPKTRFNIAGVQREEICDEIDFIYYN